jgi:cation diffusion facilitator family transporter
LIIFLAGFELLISSVSRIIHPSPVRFTWIMVFILIFSILVKLWMSVFYMNIGRRIDSSTLIASAQDSRNDVLSTALTLAAMLLSLSGISFPLDGMAGCVISLLILKAGYDIAKEIITQLLGRPLDPQLSKAICEQILSHPEILGVHDLIIHDYGPGVQIGSAHAEVDADMTLIKAHEIIDAAEEEINEKFHVNITLHTDPVETHNETMARYKAAFEEVLNHLDPDLSLHDFRLRKKGDCEEASFDILIPYDCALTQEQIHAQLKEVSETIGIQISVIYDHDYTGEA